MWKKIEPFLEDPRENGAEPTGKRGVGRKPKPARLVFDAVVFILSRGVAWNLLPKERFGSASAIHARYVRWRQCGAFKALQTSGVLKGTELASLPWPSPIEAGEAGSDPDREVPGWKAGGRREQIRWRILEAAAALFEENGGEEGFGFERTTVDALAVRANISTRTFFRYFRNKGDAIYIDWSSFLKWYERALQQNLTPDKDPILAALMTYIDELRPYVAESINRERIRRAYLSRHFAARRNSFFFELRDLTFGILRSVYTASKMSDTQLFAAASMVSQIIDSASVIWARQIDGKQNKQLVDIVWDVLREHEALSRDASQKLSVLLGPQ
ncbi:MAG TPA: transposase [Terriglobales bacterium]|nr:transposase [Terriglobales bacterium]